MNSLNIVWPNFLASRKHLPTSGSITSPVSRAMRSGPVSLNGLMIFPSLIRFESAVRSSTNFFLFSRWRLKMMSVSWFVCWLEARVLKLFNDSQHFRFWHPVGHRDLLLQQCPSRSWHYPPGFGQGTSRRTFCCPFEQQLSIHKGFMDIWGASGKQTISFRKTGIHRA